MSQTVKVEGVGAITFPDDATPDEIQQTLNRDYPPKSSALGAAGRGFLGGVFPTAAAVGAGALTAAGLEAAGAPETLGTSLLLIPPTLAAGYLAGKLQQKAIHKVAPQVEAQQQQDIQQHPIASTVGELASGLPVMRLSPGAVFRNPAQAAIAAGVGAAAGVAQPLLEGQKPTLRDVATSAAFPLLYGKPRFGGKPTPQKVVEEAAPILPRAAQAATEAIAEQPKPTEVPSATQERSVQESSQPEHTGTAPLGVSTETGGGNRPEPVAAVPEEGQGRVLLKPEEVPELPKYKGQQIKVGDTLEVVAGNMGLKATVMVRAVNPDGTIHVSGKTNSGVVFDDQWYPASKSNILRASSVAEPKRVSRSRVEKDTFTSAATEPPTTPEPPATEQVAPVAATPELLESASSSGKLQHEQKTGEVGQADVGAVGMGEKTSPQAQARTSGIAEGVAKKEPSFRQRVPEHGRVEYTAPATGKRTRWIKWNGLWFKDKNGIASGKPLDPDLTLTQALDKKLAAQSAPPPTTPEPPATEQVAPVAATPIYEQTKSREVAEALAQTKPEGQTAPELPASASIAQKEEAYGGLVRDKILNAPSFPKLLAAAKSFQKSLGKQLSPEYEELVKREPWNLLSEHAGVMNAKSARAKTLKSLADAVIKETGLPMQKPGTYRGMNYRIDWDKVAPPPPTPGAGPGTPSAAQGPDPTGQSTMAQLTDWIKQQGKISPNVPFTTRLRDSLAMAKRMTEGMDSLTQAKAKAKAAGTALIDRYVNLPKWTNFLDAVGKWVGYDQQTALEVRDFQRQIAKSVPNKMRQEAITNFIQADGDEVLLKQRASASKPNVRRGYELATQLTPEEKLLARQIQQYFDSRLQEGTEAGILKSAVEDYINQVWKRESPATSKLWADLFGIGTLNPNFKFARKRIYESYFEGEQSGLIPKNKGVGYLLSVYDLAFNRALSARGLIKSLHDGKAEDGLPIAMISEPSVRSIKEGDAPPSAFLIKPNVAPEGAVSKDGRPYLPINHWALRDWKWATKGPEGQPVFVQGDMLVHPDHYKHLDNVLKRSRLADHPITGTMLRAGALAKQTKLSLSPFHLTQEGLHGIFHRVNPANLVQLDLSNPVQKALVDHGVMVADPRAQELFAEGMTGGGLVGKIPGLGHLQNIFSEWLFRDYIPRLKMSMAMDALERNRKTYGKKASDDQLLALTAREANAAFGEQNYRLMGRSPTVQDFLRLTLLAPDFLEARGRFVGQALKPFGREQQMALGIMAATVYLGSRILNQYLDDDPHWDKPFSVMHKGKEYRLRTVLGDTQHLLTDWRNFWYNRLSPATRTIMESATSRDDRGIKRTSLEQLKDFMTWFVPIPLQRRTDTTIPQQVMAASGVSSRTLGPQQEIFKIVDDWKKNNPDPHIKEQYEKHRQETLPQSDYSPLRHALQKNDTEAAHKALTELRKTHKAQNIRAALMPRKPFTGSWASEAKFRKSLTSEQLKLYNQAMAERMELYRRYNRLLTP